MKKTTDDYFCDLCGCRLEDKATCLIELEIPEEINEKGTVTKMRLIRAELCERIVTADELVEVRHRPLHACGNCANKIKGVGFK